MDELLHTGNYIGIVIQNNDPERRGRVKVFVPHVAATLYKDWNETFKDGLDKHFNFLDKQTNPDLDKVLPYLKETLPWAEIALPTFGGASSGRYNAYKAKGTTSDSNYWDGDVMKEGFRPSQNYVRDNRLCDAFSETNSTHNRLVNPNANQYTPSDYSNLARGTFTIPNVGAHVWVFFAAGDSNYPVVFASAAGQEDWARIYTLSKATDKSPDRSYATTADYPDSYENLSALEKPDMDHNMKTFRSKHVINSNKHVFEMIDTDLSEVLKMTHYSGSFLEFNNNTTSRLATHNDQLLVLGDQFTTIRKNQSLYVANYQENIIDGDRITKLGDFEKKRQSAVQILDILKDTHQYKRLFESMRTDAKAPYTSPLQKKSGDPEKCPVCGGSGIKFDLPCITCGGSGDSPSTQDGKYILDEVAKWVPDVLCYNVWQGVNPEWVKDPTKGPRYLDCSKTLNPHFLWDEGPITTIIKKIRDNQKKIIDLQLEAKYGNGGDDLELLTGNRVTTIGTVFNDMESFRVDPVGKIRDSGVWLGKTGTYVSMAPAPLVEYVDVDSVPGGDWDVTVGNKYSLNVGSKGIRIKTTGPLDMYGSIFNISSESLNLVGKHEVLIGSGDQGTPGRVEIRGDIINLKPGKGVREEVLVDGQLGVRNNLKVVGGAHVEGELSYLHSTTPFQWYMTEIGYGPVAHTHRFKAPPWTLLDTCDQVRESQQALNQPNPAGNMKCPGFWVPA
jgi:hypothetical protein